MAPESLTDPDSVDARADLYALGAVAYFLLAGHPVFSGNLVQVLGHHLHTKPERLTERGAKCAPAFEAVVQRCLEKDPDARFQSAAELRSALLACAGGTWTRAAARAWWESERAPSRLAGSARKCLPISPWLGLRSR
jgi:serine/threonine-protein kinase